MQGFVAESTILYLPTKHACIHMPDNPKDIREGVLSFSTQYGKVGFRRTFLPVLKKTEGFPCRAVCIVIFVVVKTNRGHMSTSCLITTPSKTIPDLNLPVILNIAIQR
ncbi:uncharacterized protein isoform X2 [Musca autumnalis]|uniref:uncharacterized protein isoform X2 n=1 Tax=Musca autumnalis TaxID=221902 RepID=UPI003CE78E6D